MFILSVIFWVFISGSLIASEGILEHKISEAKREFSVFMKIYDQLKETPNNSIYSPEEIDSYNRTLFNMIISSLAGKPWLSKEYLLVAIKGINPQNGGSRGLPPMNLHAFRNDELDAFCKGTMEQPFVCLSESDFNYFTNLEIYHGTCFSTLNCSVWHLLFEGKIKSNEWIHLNALAWIGEYHKNIEIELDELFNSIEKMQKQKHKNHYEVAAHIYRTIVGIQPFYLGNGRIAELITNSYLIANRLKPFKVRLNPNSLDFNHALHMSLLKERLLSKYRNPHSGRRIGYLFNFDGKANIDIKTDSLLKLNSHITRGLELKPALQAIDIEYMKQFLLSLGSL